MTKTTTRAWDLHPGDVLQPIGVTVLDVRIDEAGTPGRTVHITHELGTLTLPLNQIVHLQNKRESALWD